MVHEEQEEEGIHQHPYKLTISTDGSWLPTVLRNDEENGMPGFYPSYQPAPYPSTHYPMPRTTQMTTSNERAVVPRQDDSVTRDIVTIEQHQDRVNWELAELENGRNGGQA